MQGAVDPSPSPAQVVGEGGQVRLAGDVELDDLGRLGKSLGDSLGDAAGPAEGREHDLGALLLGQPGDRVGDGRVGQHAGDHQSLVLQQHARTSLERAIGVAAVGKVLTLVGQGT